MYNQSVRQNLIIFFVPPQKIVNGGILSIFSQAMEARRFKNLHRSTVLVCTYPDNETYGRNDLFDNDERVYSFDQVITKWRHPRRVLFHIPETAVIRVSQVLQKKYSSYLGSIGQIHVNVMAQNINLMPSPASFADLFRITTKITQTTAHDKYTTQELSNNYQTPVHHLSVFVDKSQYKRSSYKEKENLILYSPDKHPDKEKVLATLKSLKDFEVREIKDLTYNEYKDRIRRAKFCITFGEGYDGYLVESYLSGSIGVAVFNEKFFPNKDFLSLPSIFKSYDSMKSKLVQTIKWLDNEQAYASCVTAGAVIVEKIQSYDRYIQKMKKFYLEKYDFWPEPGTFIHMIAELATEKARIDEELSRELSELNRTLAKERTKSKDIQTTLEYILNSLSWKLTRPLRFGLKTFNRLLGR